MRCEFARQSSGELDDLIDDYLSQRLPQKEAEAFEAHYLSCDECFHALQLQKQMRAVIREKGEILFAEFIEEDAKRENKTDSVPRQLPEAPRHFWQKKNFLTYTTGVAAVFLLLIIYFVNDWNKLPLTENFSESSYLEERINTQYSGRSENGFQLVSPGNGADFSPQTPIEFRWENPGNEPVTLKILNNKGDKLFSFSINDNHLLFRKELPRGLYYWKVESDDDFRIGKFFVR